MKNAILNSMIPIGLVTLFLAITPQIVAKDLPSLMLYFDFESVNGKKVEDLSGKGNHGKIVGKPKIVDGKFGKAIEMTGGDDRIEVPHSDSLVFEKGVTFVTWSKIEKWNGDGDQWIDKGAHAAKGTGCGIMVYKTSSFYFMLGDGGTRNDLTFGAGEKVPVGNAWHHITGTYNGKEMIAYGDGKPFGEKKAGFKLQCTAEVPLVVGGGVQRPQYMFEGALDEVAVFNRSLNQTEIKEIMEGIGQILTVKAEDKLPITWGMIKNFKH